MENEIKLWTFLWFSTLFPVVVGIDCYKCTSLSREVKECEDKFVKDITTEHLITRKCYYGFFKAHYCVKLKGIREDGSSIIVRQCATTNWGNHCGEIKYEVGERMENIDGCLETCDFDGCNTAASRLLSATLVTIVVLLHVVCS